MIFMYLSIVLRQVLVTMYGSLHVSIQQPV